jgi:PKD repeat protein
MKNKFEQHIKQSLENFEADYNPADWADMQNKLSKAKPGKQNSIGKGLMIAASIVTIAGVIYYLSTLNSKNEGRDISTTTSTQPIILDTKNNTRQIGVENKLQPTDDMQPIVKHKAEKENNSLVKNIAVEKPTLAAQKETRVINNTPENMVPVQEKAKTSLGDDVTSNKLPITTISASFHSRLNKVCEGAAVQFNADNNTSPCTYKWSFGDGGSSLEPNPAHVFNEAGVYAVKLIVTSVNERMRADSKNTITVIAAPLLQVNYNIAEDNNLHVNFEADGDKATEWKWNFGDNQTSSVQNPTHTYSKKGTYTAELTAKNLVGCSSVTVKEISLKNYLNLLAPNAFSPDGNGINDTWMPVTLLNGDYVFTLTILNKAGNIVYKTADKNQPWDGQNTKTGDVFIWRAIVKDKSGDEMPFQGIITISE